MSSNETREAMALKRMELKENQKKIGTCLLSIFE